MYPDGLLAVDSNTILVALYLPTQFPCIQIIADLFVSGSGPAVIIGDTLPDRREKEVYKLVRESPAITRGGFFQIDM
jgi:hypothetical protein